MDTPNQEQVVSAIRWLVTAFGTWAITKGWMNDSDATLLIGIAVALTPLVWTLIVKTNANRIKATSSIDGVKVVVAPNAPPALKEVANDNAYPNVVHERPAA